MIISQSIFTVSPHLITRHQDNCCVDWTFVLDKDDRSVARCAEYIRLLFRLAGLQIVLEELQTEFPTELYPVKMFALTEMTQS